jgi:hypothetical protein
MIIYLRGDVLVLWGNVLILPQHQFTGKDGRHARAHPILSTLARSKAVNTSAGMLAENEHLAYVVTRAGEHKCRGKKANYYLGAS